MLTMSISAIHHAEAPCRDSNRKSFKLNVVSSHSAQYQYMLDLARCCCIHCKGLRPTTVRVCDLPASRTIVLMSPESLWPCALRNTCTAHRQHEARCFSLLASRSLLQSTAFPFKLTNTLINNPSQAPLGHSAQKTSHRPLGGFGAGLAP